ncbi:MAG: LCP family protein [Clostridia bacterium]|nr:LCP family protein [Clostridia bacterium]
MSRSHKKNKYDSDKEVSLKRADIKAYSEDKDAFPVYIPSLPEGKKKKKGKKILLILLLIFFLLIAGAVGTFFILQYQGQKNLVSYDDVTIGSIDEAIVQNDGKTVTYNGKTYRLNENITSIACMGIDKMNLGTYGDKIGTAGQADTNMVLAIDTQSGKVTVITIPRDIMVDIGVYSVNGEYVGIENWQLCLAYAYGDGKHTSCINTVEAIQRILFGIPVKSYISLDMDGIGPINDSVGGVTVTSPETIADFYAGQAVTLYGNRAVDFVRARGDDTGASLRRMQRQMAYVSAFASTAVNSAKKDLGTITRLYNTASRYSCTNVDLSSVTYLASTLLSKGVTGIETVSIPGEMKQGEKYAEFYMDTRATYEMILSVFYTEVE